MEKAKQVEISREQAKGIEVATLDKYLQQVHGFDKDAAVYMRRTGGVLVFIELKGE